MADDGNHYWVKGSGAGQMGLCAEWIAGRLGREFGLPIPELAQVEVSIEFIQQSAFPEIEDLGAGIKFGSKHVEGCQEYDATLLAVTPDNLKIDVLAFDLWIRNTDRTFSRPFGSSGNPNLLWEPMNAQLWVIDHNNAFLPDDLLQASGFQSHVFYEARRTMNASIRSKLSARMAGLIESTPIFFQELPEEWLFLNNERTITTQMTGERMLSILSGVVEDNADFWRDLQ
jgi:hypothetical protein